MKSLAELCKAMEDLSKLYNGDKRSWDDVFMGLGGVCVDLKTTIMAEIGEKRQNVGINLLNSSLKKQNIGIILPNSLLKGKNVGILLPSPLLKGKM